MTDQHQEANLDGTFDAFRASGDTWDATTLTHDMIVQGFRGLPLWQRMQEAAEVLDEADRRLGRISGEWTRGGLVCHANRWEAEDRAATEREAMAEELAREMAATFKCSHASEHDRNRARKLIDAGWHKDGSKEKR